MGRPLLHCYFLNSFQRNIHAGCKPKILENPAAGHNAAMQLNFIGHHAIASLSGRTLPVIDPSDGQPFDEIQRSDARDIDAAVRAARACFDGPWSALSAAERGRLLMALSRLVAIYRRARRSCTCADSWDQSASQPVNVAAVTSRAVSSA